MNLSIQIQVLDCYAGLPLPAYETQLAAGMDLRSAEAGSIVLSPMERRAIRTGLKVAIPAGYEGQVRPRSGLALRQGIGIINSPGTIDADYRGEILIPLINLGTQPISIERGDRIAQFIVAPVMHIMWEKVDILDETPRNEGGFGHTGSF